MSQTAPSERLNNAGLLGTCWNFGRWIDIRLDLNGIKGHWLWLLQERRVAARPVTSREHTPPIGGRVVLIVEVGVPSGS